jgi:hypothetical protein
MTHQTATVATTDDALSDLETFAATYAGYSIIAGSTPSYSGYATSRVYRKTGKPDIHLSYNSSNDITSQGGRHGAILCAIDTANSGASFNWAASTTTYEGGNEVASYKCPISVASPAKNCTKYHFFTNGSEIWVVLKLGDYGYLHFGFGELGFKAGAWTGGTFFAPCNAMNNYTGNLATTNNPASLYHNWFVGPLEIDNLNVRQVGQHFLIYLEGDDTASPPLKKWGINLSSPATMSDTSQRTYLTDISPLYSLNEALSATVGWVRGANAYNGRTVGTPFDLLAYDDNVDLWRYIGQLQGMRIVNIEHLNAEDIINTDWMVFPLANTGNRNADYFPETGTIGVAYKRYGLSS